MTLQQVSKDEMLYIQSKYPQAVFSVTNKQHPKKKTRYLEMNDISIRLHNEYQKIIEEKTIEKHGWFDEFGEDGKVRRVYYK